MLNNQVNFEFIYKKEKKEKKKKNQTNKDLHHMMQFVCYTSLRLY